MQSSEYLFSPSFIKIKPKGYDEKFVLRPLHIGDFEKGFTQVLGQLTEIGNYEKQRFISVFKMVREKANSFIFVVEDKSVGKIVGCATLLVEQKFIRNGGKVVSTIFAFFFSHIPK